MSNVVFLNTLYRPDIEKQYQLENMQAELRHAYWMIYTDKETTMYEKASAKQQYWRINRERIKVLRSTEDT